MSGLSKDEITITLGGEPVTLGYTLRATKEINRVFGDFLSGSRRLDAFDFDAYAAIVAAGTGKKRADVEEKVFAAGMDALIKPLGDYILRLSRGGRAANLEDGDKGTGEA
jgi:hypothetical protein